MFAQSDPDAVTSTLRAAGYDDIEFTAVRVTFPLGADADEATEYLAGTGVGRALLETVARKQRAEALDAVRDALAAHTDSRGVHLDGAVWIITAEVGSRF